MRALLTADRNQHFARSPHDRGPARGHARGRLPPVHHRRRRHRPRRRRARAQPGPPLRRGRRARATTSRTRSPGAKKCGHQGGKVLVAEDEQIKRLNAARFQLDVMSVPGIIVARTDAESATFLDGRGDERDQPFILGATNVELPTYKIGYLAILKRLSRAGRRRRARPPAVQGLRRRVRRGRRLAGAVGRDARASRTSAKALKQADGAATRGAAATRSRPATSRRWQAEASLKTYPQAVADVIQFRAERGRALRHERRRVAGLREPHVASTPRAPRPGRWASTSSGTARSRRRPRATTRCRAASSTRSPSRWPPRRSPTCSGWRPRPPTWPTPGASPRRSTPSSPTRCWPTTSRPRSTGTRPA